MRRVTFVYSIAAIWTFGWLTGTFGLLPSLFASAIVFAPVASAWRMLVSKRAIKRREYGYLATVSLLAITATGFIVVKWYDTGMDRLAVFDREYDAFHKRISSMPEYKNVEISYTHRKGGRVYLHGDVANKDSHDRLLQTYERMVRNNDSGYYDGVDYPGKPTGHENETASLNGDEIG